MDPLNQEFIRLLAATDWNQSEAARRLSLSPATVSQYIKGTTRPSLTIIRMFKMLTGDTVPLPGESASDALHDAAFVPTDDELQMLLKLRGKEPQTRRTVLDAMSSLLSVMPDHRASYGSKKK